MDAAQLYQAGELSEAIAAANDAVRQRPADTARRGLLCELLCVAGNLERADAQLEIIGNQDAKSTAGVSLLRQLVRAAQTRQEFFVAGRIPDVLSEPGPAVRGTLEAWAELRAGNATRAAELLGAVEEGRPPLAGVMNGTAFADLRDLDDLFAGVFEVLTSTGKYYWVPMADVTRLAPRRPERPVDLLWLPAEMSVRDGPDGVVYLPTVYGGTVPDDGDALRLGRATDWDETKAGIVRGRGLRMFLVGDADLSPMELGEIVFGPAAGGTEG